MDGNSPGLTAPVHVSSRRPAAGQDHAPAAGHAPAVRIEVRDLDFYYGANHALKSISLPIVERDVTAFIGPSGCGKSTLVRCFNRMFDLYRGHRATGEILLDGQNILGRDVDVTWLRSRVGMVFQKPTPFPMSIFDNVAFGISLREKVPRSVLRERVSPGGSLSTEATCTTVAWTRWRSAGGSAWSSRNRTPSRPCPSSTTSLPVTS